MFESSSSNCLFFRWFSIRNLFVICFFRIFWLLFVLFEFMRLFFFFYHDHAVVWSLKLLYVWWFTHFWKCNVFDYQSFSVSVSFSKSTSLSSFDWSRVSLKCLNWNSSFVFNKNFDVLTTNAKTFKNLIKFVSRLSDHIFFLNHQIRNIRTACVASFVFSLRMNISKNLRFRFWKNNFLILFFSFWFERLSNFLNESFVWIFSKFFWSKFWSVDELFFRWFRFFICRFRFRSLECEFHF